MELDSDCRFLTTCLQILAASSIEHRGMDREEASYHSAARISDMKCDSSASTLVRSASSF